MQYFYNSFYPYRANIHQKTALLYSCEFSSCVLVNLIDYILWNVNGGLILRLFNHSHLNYRLTRSCINQLHGRMFSCETPCQRYAPEE